MKYKALSVRQPFADLLTNTKEGGNALKTIELRTRNIKYRGDLVICSTASPVLPERLSGCAVGIVELYATKPAAELTEKEWEQCCVSSEIRKKAQNGWAWFFRNPRRVIEIPVKGKLGLFDLEINDLQEYPHIIALDDKGWELIQKQIKAARI